MAMWITTNAALQAFRLEVFYIIQAFVQKPF
jgi:hypothetical protein